MNRGSTKVSNKNFFSVVLSLGTIIFLVVGAVIFFIFLGYYFLFYTKESAPEKNVAGDTFEWNMDEKSDLSQSEVITSGTNKTTSNQGRTSLVSGDATPVLYDDRITAGWENWSHGITLTEQVNDVARGKILKVSYVETYGRLRLHTDTFVTKGFNSLTFDVRGPLQNINDLLITLRDNNDKEVSYQSVGWYSSIPVEDDKTWYRIVIPLENLGSLAEVSDVIFQSAIVGDFYFDNIKFSPLDIKYPEWKQGGVTGERAWYEVPWDVVSDTNSQALAHVPNWYDVYGSDISVNLSTKKTAFRLEPNTEASLAIYMKGRDWSDYVFSAVVDWENISTVGLASRVKDAKNFVYCSFYGYGSGVGLYEVRDGEDIFIRSGSAVIPALETWNDISLSISIHGNTVSCMKDKISVVSGVIETMPTTGSVGIKLWNKDPKNEGIVIENISVNEVSY
ncbi:MAG: hypothetical protein WDZ75_01065 [Candidatus Paceibacterota bacterium]